MSTVQPPKIILGCNEFNSAIDLETTQRVVQRFVDHHDNNHQIYIDTAVVYGNGKSELSLAPYSNNPNIFISTKITPSKDNGRLTKKSIKLQCNLSLKRLNTDCVDILYIHSPSQKTPILESLFAINQLYKEGKFKRFGVCHYSAWQIAEMVYLCDKYNLVKPSVYQGRYNALRREIEYELIACLRHFNIAFYAFSPTARGLFAGMHTFEDKQNNNIKPGKFTSKHKAIHFVDYWYKSFFNARDHIQNISNKENTSLLQANFCWLLYHSCLNGTKGDRIIIGGSKYQHFHDNLIAITNSKPLNKPLIDAFERGWKIARQEGLRYHRTFQDLFEISTAAKTAKL